MLKIYNTDLETNKFEEIKELKRGAWINMINPSDSEIKRICKETGIEEEFIRYPLDYEEQARIDIEDNSTLFIIDVPIIEETKERKSIYYYATWYYFCWGRLFNNSSFEKK